MRGVIFISTESDWVNQGAHQNSEIQCPVKMTVGVSLKESMPDSESCPWMDMVTNILSPQSSLARVSIVVVDSRLSSNPEMMPSLP